MYIYRLFINDKHKSICFNENRKNYNCRLYITIRQLGITKDNFYDFVKIETFYQDIPEIFNKKMDNDFGYNLWNELNADFDIKEYTQIYYKNNKEKIQIYQENNKSRKWSGEKIVTFLLPLRPTDFQKKISSKSSGHRLSAS